MRCTDALYNNPQQVRCTDALYYNPQQVSCTDALYNNPQQVRCTDAKPCFLVGLGIQGGAENHWLLTLMREQTSGRMYGQRISPLIAFIFYPPSELKKIGMYEARLGLSGQPKRI